jgi:hypothetical protein
MVSVKSNNIQRKALYHTNLIKSTLRKRYKKSKMTEPLHVGT